MTRHDITAQGPPLTGGARLGLALAAGEVDQVQLANLEATACQGRAWKGETEAAEAAEARRAERVANFSHGAYQPGSGFRDVD